MTPSEADAASLRRAFNRAAETCPPNWLPPGLPKKVRDAIEDAFRDWWAEFYHAIASHNAGMQILGELARARVRVAALEAALRPFAARSEECRRIADVVAGQGKPCSMQPVRLEDLIRAAEVLAAK